MRVKERYPIDVRRIISSKNPSVAKRIPEWIISLLSKIIHVDDLNYMLNTYPDLPPMDFAGKTIEYTGASYSIKGTENIPDEKCIFVSNHPLGGLDGLIIIHSLSKYCTNGIKLIVNDLLMFLEPLRPLFIPVNKHGKQTSEYRNLMDEAYASDCQIVTFPAGLCSRLIDGKITDLVWHRSFAMKAEKSNRIIVPIYFEGRNSMRFYRLAKIRKWLGIKFNIEMLFLPHEMFRPTCKHITIHVGEPIKPDYSRPINDIVNEVRDAVYSMRPK